MARAASPSPTLVKVPTGISGFDEITGGGVPLGRPTLVCGGAGCGKSLFSIEFLMRGIKDYNEPGVLFTFEETVDDIRKNVASLGFDVEKLCAQKKLVIDHVSLRREEIEENGEYDLEGLFIRIAHAVKQVKAKRLVLDTIETLFAGLRNEGILRGELQRLFSWLKERNLTTLITGERGTGQLTRHGLEEYVSDCVVLLDHRVQEQISTRRLRIVKYRGSTHGTNEYPFLIDETGLSVLPVTSVGMEHPVSNERIASGVPELDAMIGGKGIYRGSSLLVSGTAGTGKTSLGMHFSEASCRRGEKCLFFSFEESPLQLIRNAKSIGINLQPHVDKGLMQIHSSRPTTHGIEMHLLRMHKLIDEFKPSLVVLDPISSLAMAGSVDDSATLFVRLIDYLRKKEITSIFLHLTRGGPKEETQEGISSMVDTWLLARDVESNGERNRVLYVLKARGISHSNQLREFHITSKGIRLIPAYIGPNGVLTGTARLSQEARERTESQSAEDEIKRQELAFRHRRAAVEAQIASLRAGLMAEEEDFKRFATVQEQTRHQMALDREAMIRTRFSRHSLPPEQS